ncbi:AfsR/SARP family transcriptional regulator [Actinomadura fibrosa]|uniref:BTAD domain-containing putative transcriptional regulator n=1 Tax=Actinomadura fibrosa TaxID=111802 RepID=A0ABW2XH34_9ACTN|nr:BTAD domain-containing putative transcriptional regulator [Actinomadura fibrosa]
MGVELVLLGRVAYRGVEISSPRVRGLLALLAGERAGLGVGRLVEGLWPDGRPEHPAKALQVLVSRARARLGAGVIASTPSGYRLALAEDAVDVWAVLVSASECARSVRAGDHAAALAHAEAGLALWDGPPEVSCGEDPLSRLRAERAVTYRELLRARGLALSRLGRRAEAVDVLTGLARERPRDEEVLLELLRCEAATTGASSALARYEAYRRALRDELGTDPGAALQAVQRELLQEGAPTVRRGIRHEPNPLLGRDRDLAAVRELLGTSRVTSIVGPGGLGKTRLANAVAREAEQRTVHVVALAGVARDEDVVAEVASVVGVGEPQPPSGRLGQVADPVAGIAEALGTGGALLVLDNCEHVVRGAAGLVGALVAMTRDLRVLTTGRAPLGLSSESVYPLPELDLPTAVELFRQRARAARPGAGLPADAVEEVCRHLDGLPLAVELAAARVRVMSVPEIARRLDDRFALLRGGARDAPERHRTMRAVVDWSWNILGPSGRAAMRALSVFPGGFTADAAEYLLAGDDDVLTVLQDLVDQSLIEAVGTGLGTRFRMLETVREFSAAHREAAGESGRVVDGLLAWARDFGAAHHEAIFGGDPFPAMELFRAEQDNLLLALRHGLARRDGPSVAAVTAVLAGLMTVETAFGRLATLSGDVAGLLSRYRPAPDGVDVTRTALALCTMAMYLLKGAHAMRTLVALRRLPTAPPTTPARAIAAMVRDSPELLRPGSTALDDLCRGDDPLLAGIAAGVVGYILEREGDLEGALKVAGMMLQALDDRESRWLRTLAHARLGELHLQLDDGARSKHHLRAALRELERFDPGDTMGVRWGMTVAHLQLGEIDEAEHWLRQSATSGPYGPDVAFGAATFDLGAHAEIALARGETEAGLRLWRQAAARLEDADSPVPSLGRGMDPWTLETHCAAVIAHARHGRPEAVERIAAGLPAGLAGMLAEPCPPAPPFFMDLPVCGSLLLALASMDLARAPSPPVRARAARMIALAERFRFFKTFQPTMSTAHARRAAEDADGPAYSAAVSEYAGLDREALRAAARAILRDRATGTDRGRTATSTRGSPPAR